jgi:hypothetical protein
MGWPDAFRSRALEMTGHSRAAMVVLAVAMQVGSARTLAADDETPAVATLQWPGAILGTVLWTGRPRSWFGNDGGCEVHESDMEGHPGVQTGLANVVVVAQPLGRENQRWFHEHPSESDEDAELDWDEQLSPPVVAVPSSRSLVIRNKFGIDRQLFVYRGRARVETIEIGANAEQKVTLPEGIVRLGDATSGAKAWVYVSPYPAWVTSGNCRFAFSNLPPGRYRLTGWHPRAGRRSREFPVRRRGIHYLTPLLFGATAQDACNNEGFFCYGPDRRR